MITVLLADDNAIVRAGVRAMLSREADIDVVATAEDGVGLVAATEQLLPQVVVTDIRMPPDFQQEGIDAARATGGTLLDPVIVDALMNPVADDGLSGGAEQLLRMLAEGLPIKAIALARPIPPEATAREVEELFLDLAQQAGAGRGEALRRQAALAMHAAQDEVNSGWAADGLPPFPLGIGVSTGVAAAALLGSDEHLEYTWWVTR